MDFNRQEITTVILLNLSTEIFVKTYSLMDAQDLSVHKSL